jgi:hypothetical protein
MRRFWTLPLAVLVAVVMVGVPLAAVGAPGHWSPLRTAVLWGLGVILCFVGWGGWLRRRLLPEVEVDWGLEAAWGMALTLAVGGPLCLLGLARRTVLLVWAFAGIALAARGAARAVAGWRRAGPRAPRSWDGLVLAGLVGLVAFVFVGSATRSGPNPSDDWVAYLPFIHKLVQTGTLIEPFSVRRMASYGGQTLFQALTLMASDDAQIQLFDQGICLVVLVGVVLGFARGARGARVVAFLLVLVLVMLPEVRINSASEVSGALGFLAAFRTIVLVDRERLRGWHASLLVALTIAAVSTLRQPNMFVAGFMVLALLIPTAGEAPADRRRRFLEVAALTAAILLPWSTLAFRSNHTFLFPLFPGNYDPSYAGITPSAHWEPRLRFYLGALFHDEPIRVMPILLLAAPAVARGPNRRALLGLWVGTIVAFALVVLSLPESDNFTVARYGFASVVALAVATGLAASDPGATAPGEPEARVEPIALALIAVAFGIQIQTTHGTIVHNFGGALGRIFAADRSPPPMAVTAPEVRKMQAAIPAGAPMLVMIERPFLLDFTRNPIVLFDQPGAASPRRALPLMAGGEAVARYLVGEGLRYFAFAWPDRPQNDLYRRAHWKAMLQDPRPNAPGAARLYLAAFDAADYLARTRHKLYDDGHLVVVDLAASGG